MLKYVIFVLRTQPSKTPVQSAILRSTTVENQNTNNLVKISRRTTQSKKRGIERRGDVSECYLSIHPLATHVIDVDNLDLVSFSLPFSWHSHLVLLSSATIQDRRHMKIYQWGIFWGRSQRKETQMVWITTMISIVRIPSRYTCKDVDDLHLVSILPFQGTLKLSPS